MRMALLAAQGRQNFSTSLQRFGHDLIAENFVPAARRTASSAGDATTSRIPTFYSGVAMRFVLIALAAFCALATPSRAADEPPVKGQFLLTDYPAVTVRPGTTATVNLHLQNYAMPPERLALSLSGVPTGWTATLIGGGQPIAAALPASNASVAIELRIDVPKDAPMGTTNIVVNAKGDASNVSLPLAVTIAQDLPAQLSVQPQLT
jgi:hypothetical protein